MIVALIREVSSAMDRCELTYLPRTTIDIELARRQHRQYADALSDLGCQVLYLPERPQFPDSVFVEDVAVVLDELAVLARPGAASRRGEVAEIELELAKHRPIHSIVAPGTLEGGDVLHVGRNIYVGVSGRTNRDGIAQLRVCAAEHGYQVQPIEVHGCLHLKSAVTEIGPGMLLFNPDWVEAKDLSGNQLVTVDREEPHAANALLVGGHLLYPASFPRTRAKLEGMRLDVVALDLSELQKAEGAVTCCSLLFEATSS